MAPITGNESNDNGPLRAARTITYLLDGKENNEIELFFKYAILQSGGYQTCQWGRILKERKIGMETD
jgi:hypothetical protein